MSDVFYCLFAATTPKLYFYLNCLEVGRECFTGGGGDIVLEP